MLDLFFPNEYLENVYEVPFERLYERGFRGIIFDIDNTLVPHGEPSDEKVESLFSRLKEIGFETCLLSNNQKERVEDFNQFIQTHAIYDGKKPQKTNYLKGMELMGTRRRTTVFIGDQLFTDIFGARRVGMYNILVKPIHPKEEIQIVLKRYLEKLVLHFYQKRKEKLENKDSLL